MKKFLISMLAFMLLLTGIPVQANELNGVPEQIITTVYPKKDNANLINIGVTLFDQKGTKFKSTDKSVAVLKQKYFYSTNVGGKELKNYSLYLNTKKAGKTTVSFKYDKKTYKIPVTVCKYKNPISSIKIGSKTISSGKFKNSSVYTLKYKDFANKDVKVKIKFAKDWKLQALNYFWIKGATWGAKGPVSNGNEIRVENGSGFTIYIPVVNTKTGQEEQVLVYFK